MADIFREVDEAVREDRAKQLWRRYGRLIVAAVVIILGATAGYVWWQDYRSGQMQQATVALAAALNRTGGSAIEGADALRSVAATAEGGVAMLARLYEAALLADAGDREAAVAVYARVAEDPDVERLWRDYALLMAVLHQLDTGEPATLTATLAPLVEPGNPWSYTARELVGLLAVRQGERSRAAEVFAELAEDQNAPAGVRARADDLAGWLGADRETGQ
jgi:hypothetical protein